MRYSIRACLTAIALVAIGLCFVPNIGDHSIQFSVQHFENGMLDFTLENVSRFNIWLPTASGDHVRPVLFFEANKRNNTPDWHEQVASCYYTWKKVSPGEKYKLFLPHPKQEGVFIINFVVKDRFGFSHQIERQIEVFDKDATTIHLKTP